MAFTLSASISPPYEQDRQGSSDIPLGDARSSSLPLVSRDQFYSIRKIRFPAALSQVFDTPKYLLGIQIFQLAPLRKWSLGRKTYHWPARSSPLVVSSR